MNVILFGASGMIGQGVLRECIASPDVTRVLCVGRRALGQTHDKITELLHDDFTDFSPVAADLQGYDACFWCLGVSSAGMREAEYTKVTYEYTMAAARVLARESPSMTFVFVSGAGTDGTEKGRSMWARVKGRTENAIFALPFKASYAFRPAMIVPLHGVVSRTPLYRAVYAIMGPLLPILKPMSPGYVTTTEIVGKAMLKVAKGGASAKVLENRDINALVEGEG